jgi:hypothetical protein
MDERWDSQWGVKSGSFQFPVDEDAQSLLSGIARVEQFSECWLAFRQWIRGCSSDRRPFLPRRSKPLAHLALLAQKVEALSMAIESLQLQKRCLGITADQIACIQHDVTCPPSAHVESMITELLNLEYEMGEDSISWFVDAHKDTPAEVLRSLWDATPMALLDPAEQAEQILAELDVMSPSEVTAALFWICCAQKLDELKEGSREWMKSALETLARLKDEVNENSLRMFGRTSVESLAGFAARISALAEEIHDLKVLAEQFSGCSSVVLDLYYKGKAQVMSDEERRSFQDCIRRGDAARNRTTDVILHGQTPDRATYRMFVSQADASCLIAITIIPPHR